MPHIRKAAAGGDSFGNEWPVAGAVVEVSPEQAAALLAIADGGFAEVAPPALDDPEDSAETGFAEVAEDAVVSEAPKAPARRGRPPKPKPDPQLVEE